MGVNDTNPDVPSPTKAQQREEIVSAVRTWSFLALLVAMAALTIWAFFFRQSTSMADRLELENPNLVLLRAQSSPSQALGGSAYARAQSRIFENFIEKFPDYRFLPVTQLRLPGALSGSGDILSFLGDTAPDVFQRQDFSYAPYIEQNFARPLNELAEAAGVDLGALIPENVRPLVERDGKIYGVPVNKFVWGLTYRKDIFEEVGLPREFPMETWEDFYYACMKVTGEVTLAGRKIRRVGLFLDKVGTGFWGDRQFACFLFSAGGEILSEKDGEFKVAFDSPAGLEAVRFIRRLLWGRWVRNPDTGEPMILRDKNGEQICTDEELSAMIGQTLTCPENGNSWVLQEQDVETGVARVSDERGLVEFMRGESAIQLSMPNLIVQNLSRQHLQISPQDIGISAMPVGPTGTPGDHRAYCEFSFMGISGTLDPETDARVIEAAFDYVAFRTSPDVERIQTEIFVEEGEFVFVNPLQLRRQGFAHLAEQLPAGWLEAYEKMEAGATAIPSFDNLRAITEDMWGFLLGTLYLSPNEDPAALLEQTAIKTTRSVLRQYTEEEMRFYRTIAFVLILLAAVLVVYAGFKIILNQKRKIDETPGLGKVAKRVPPRVHIAAALMLAPAVVLTLVWAYFPLLWGTLMAFFEFKVLEGFSAERFVGLDNFILVILDPLFWPMVLNTLWFVALNITLNFTTPILLAILLSEIPIGRYFFRTVFFLPAVTTGIVTVLLWTMFFSSADTGLLNQILGLVGIPPQRWLNDPRWAMFCVVMPSVWGTLGTGSIVYLAALKNVPEDCYEAADLDGAGFFTKFRHITMPVIWPLVLITFLGAFIASFQGMGNILLMTGGGPVNATRVIGLEIWLKAFIYLDYGKSTALSWVLGSYLLGFTVFQLRLMSMMRFERSKGFDKNK